MKGARVRARRSVVEGAVVGEAAGGRRNALPVNRKGEGARGWRRLTGGREEGAGWRLQIRLSTGSRT